MLLYPEAIEAKEIVDSTGVILKFGAHSASSMTESTRTAVFNGFHLQSLDDDLVVGSRESEKWNVVAAHAFLHHSSGRVSDVGGDGVIERDLELETTGVKTEMSSSVYPSTSASAELQQQLVSDCPLVPTNSSNGRAINSDGSPSEEGSHGVRRRHRSHICPVCNKNFFSSKGLVQHQIIHTDQKPFDCKICGKAFRFKSNLFEHKSLHAGVNPYICQFCGKSCRLKGNLKKHLKTHIKNGDNFDLEKACRDIVCSQEAAAKLAAQKLRNRAAAVNAKHGPRELGEGDGEDTSDVEPEQPSLLSDEEDEAENDNCAIDEKHHSMNTDDSMFDESTNEDDYIPLIPGPVNCDGTDHHIPQQNQVSLLVEQHHPQEPALRSASSIIDAVTQEVCRPQHGKSFEDQLNHSGLAGGLKKPTRYRTKRRKSANENNPADSSMRLSCTGKGEGEERLYMLESVAQNNDVLGAAGPSGCNKNQFRRKGKSLGGSQRVVMEGMVSMAAGSCYTEQQQAYSMTQNMAQNYDQPHAQHHMPFPPTTTLGVCGLNSGMPGSHEAIAVAGSQMTAFGMPAAAGLGGGFAAGTAAYNLVGGAGAGVGYSPMDLYPSFRLDSSAAATYLYGAPPVGYSGFFGGAGGGSSFGDESNGFAGTNSTILLAAPMASQPDSKESCILPSGALLSSSAAASSAISCSSAIKTQQCSDSPGTEGSPSGESPAHILPKQYTLPINNDNGGHFPNKNFASQRSTSNNLHPDTEHWSDKEEPPVPPAVPVKRPVTPKPFLYRPPSPRKIKPSFSRSQLWDCFANLRFEEMSSIGTGRNKKDADDEDIIGGGKIDAGVTSASSPGNPSRPSDQMHQSQRYCCESCKEDFQCRRDLEAHFLSSTSSACAAADGSGFICVSCLRIFDGQASLDEHRAVHERIHSLMPSLQEKIAPKGVLQDVVS